MRLRTILLSISAAVVLLVLGAAAVLSQIDLSPYFKNTTIDKVAEATGRKLTINGEMKLKLLPVPALTVRDVTFANPDGIADPYMIKAGELSAKIALRPLLFGRTLRIERLTLKDVDLHLATDANGRGNWQFGATTPPPPGPAAQGAPTLPSFGEVVLSNIAITYHDGRTGKTTTASLKEVSATSSSTGPVKIVASANYQGLPIEVNATTGPPASLMTPGTPFAVDANIAIPGVTAKLIGSVAEPLAGRGLNLAVTFNIQDPGTIGALLGVSLPGKPFRLAATINGDADGTMAIKALQASMGASAISGDATLAVGGARPHLGAKLDAPMIDLTDLPTMAPEPRRTGNNGRVFSNDSLPLSSLGMVDADITLNAATVKSSAVTLQGLSVNLTLADRNLLVHRFDLDLDGGHIGGTADVSSRQRPASVAFQIDAKQLDIGKILDELSGSDLLEAKGDLAITVHGKGDSVRALMATLDGSSNLVVGRGIIKNRYADLVGADVFREAFAWAQGKQDSKLTCMVSRFDIRNGLATSRALLIDTSDVTVAGTGTVNLGSEQLDLTLAPRPKETSLLSLATPIDIGGTFTQPSVQPNKVAMAKDVAKSVATFINPLFAIVPMILDQGDDKNPCVAALSQNKPAPQKDEGGIAGAAKGLGRSIGDIFR